MSALTARREAGPPGWRQLDGRRDPELLQASLAARRAACSGRAECRPRGCHCGRQDRGVTPVGLRSVPLGRSGLCVSREQQAGTRARRV